MRLRKRIENLATSPAVLRALPSQAEDEVRCDLRGGKCVLRKVGDMLWLVYQHPISWFGTVS